MKIYNKIYKVSPWKDNELFYTVVQGEGGIKYPRLQIIDENGAIDLSNSTLTYTITLPDNSEEIVNGEILDAKFGIVEFGIVASMSSICGIAKGNLNILSGENVLKVGGINLVIEPATEGHEIEASEKFSALTEALHKVVTLTPEGTAVIPDGSITTEKLADNAVTSDKIADNSITEATIQDGSVSNRKIASKSVTVEKLAEDVTNQLSELKDDISDRNITLDFNHVGYIDKKGKLSTLVTSFKTTDFIAISSRVIVKGEFRDLNSPLYYVNCYDSNKNYLGGTINAINIDGNKLVNVNGIVTLIEGTCFIRVTNSIKSISLVKMWYSLSNTGDLSSVNQKIEESKTNNSIYSNIINDGLGFSVFSKFASVGDSLSVGYNTEKDGTPISEDLKHSWGAYIEKRYGTKSFWTGKSGQTCKTWLNTTSETWGLNYCKSIGTMPLYVICMGANESGINIGTTDDIDTDNDTLYGYVSKVINELRNISPKSYVVCTGVSREQPNSPKINDVYKTVCELKEKCYYLDCFKEFNSEPFTSYYFNWHYSASGYSAMANLFNYKLKEVMAKNIEDFKYVNEADN